MVCCGPWPERQLRLEDIVVNLLKASQQVKMILKGDGMKRINEINCERVPLDFFRFHDCVKKSLERYGCT